MQEQQEESSATMPSSQQGGGSQTSQEAAAYRRKCRKYYRQTTSFESSDEDESSSVDHEESSKNDKDNDDDDDVVANALLVVQAVDRLTEGKDSYQKFLATQSSQQEKMLALAACGLPTDDASLESTLHNADALKQLIAIRSEERQLAHQVNMNKRLDKVYEILKEEQQPKQQQTTTPFTSTTSSSSSSSSPSQQKLMTHSEIRQKKLALQSFVQRYAKKFIATHPLLAGMRQILQHQLNQDNVNSEPPISLLWSFDAAILSEAVVAQQQGADDSYIRHAVAALCSFLVCIPTTTDANNLKTNDATNNNNNSATLTFAVDPSLSDRTLSTLLQALPPFKELDARPTGKVSTPTQSQQGNWIVRHNVDGELDEMDICTAWMKQALQLFR